MGAKQLKLLVAGGRDFNNVILMEGMLESLLKRHKASGVDLVVISGMAKGADKMAYNWAKKMGVEVLPMPAEWDNIDGKPEREIGFKNGRKYWKMAGFARNAVMVDICDYALVFWDKKSPGTKDTIQRLKDKKKPFYEENY